jgi:hypothetical protein
LLGIYVVKIGGMFGEGKGIWFCKVMGKRKVILPPWGFGEIDGIVESG